MKRPARPRNAYQRADESRTLRPRYPDYSGALASTRNPINETGLLRADEYDVSSLPGSTNGRLFVSLRSGVWGALICQHARRNIVMGIAGWAWAT